MEVRNLALMIHKQAAKYGEGIEFSSNEDLIKNPQIIEFYKERIANRSKKLS